MLLIADWNTLLYKMDSCISLYKSNSQKLKIRLRKKDEYIPCLCSWINSIASLNGEI